MPYLLHKFSQHLIHQRRAVHVAADGNRVQCRHQIGRGHAAQFGFFDGHGLRYAFCSGRANNGGGWGRFWLALSAMQCQQATAKQVIWAAGFAGSQIRNRGLAAAAQHGHLRLRQIGVLEIEND